MRDIADAVLRPGRERSVRRRHPWVLSGAVDRLTGAAEPGDVVRVLSASGEVLGRGHWSPASKLRIRMLGFGKDDLEEDWLSRRITAAVARRAEHPALADTDAVRLVNAEGDALPGLVVDRFGPVVVAKLLSAGMAAERDAIGETLRSATGAASGFERADTAAARREGVASRDGPLWGPHPEGPVWIDERRRRYAVDVVGGQKTGFYLDQRDARDLVASVASGRRVLDLFAYSGGFSVAAAAGGASAVTLVETSAAAIELARCNLTENAPDLPARFERADVHRFLRDDGDTYDLLVVDPPPLARHKRDVSRATRAYKDALLYAFARAAPGAQIFTFACSHTIDASLFRKIVFGAALDARREARVLRVLGSPVDHPVSIDHPEGEYLTGLWLEA